MALFKCSVLVLVVVSLTVGEYYEQRYEELLAELRKYEKSNDAPLWEFGMNKYFEKKSRMQIHRLFGVLAAKESVNETESNRFAEEANDTIILPKEYDVRKAYPHCKLIPFIKDQSGCGSDWAVSAASVMSDRICIASNGSKQFFVSDQHLTSCCWDCGDGCHGGYPDETFEYWKTVGIPSGGPYGWKNGCQPYAIAPCGKYCPDYVFTPFCMENCTTDSKLSIRMDRSHGGKVRRLKGMTAIMQELYKNGPLVAVFMSKEDILYYKKGIYRHRFGNNIGYHAVRLLGWGEEKGVKYWLIANSWNTTFGENGYFRMIRGIDECGIESRVSGSRARILTP